MFESQEAFYHSKAWEKFRLGVIAQRTDSDGFVRCAHCGKPIVRKYDLILHHVNELSEANVNDHAISLNPDNVVCVHHACHNDIHGAGPGGRNKGYRPKAKEAWLVYGSPFSGKTTHVADIAGENDIVVDLDMLWDAVSPLGDSHGARPIARKATVFALRDCLYDVVKHRAGKWHTAFIIATVPLARDRERLARQLNLTGVRLMDASEGECLARVARAGLSDEARAKQEGLVRDWFARYQPDAQADDIGK